MTEQEHIDLLNKETFSINEILLLEETKLKKVTFSLHGERLDPRNKDYQHIRIKTKKLDQNKILFQIQDLSHQILLEELKGE